MVMYEKDGEVFPQKHCLAASILQVCRWPVFHVMLQILLTEIPGAVLEPSFFELKEVDHRWKYIDDQGCCCRGGGHWESSCEMKTTDEKGRHCLGSGVSPVMGNCKWDNHDARNWQKKRFSTSSQPRTPWAHQLCIHTLAHVRWSHGCPDLGPSVRQGGAVLPCTRMESPSLMQLLILLAIRRTTVWKSESDLTSGASLLRLALSLFKKRWVNASGRMHGAGVQQLGAQGENGERTGQSVTLLCWFFLSILPMTSLAFSRCVMSYSMSFRQTRAPTSGSSTIKMEQPKKTLYAAPKMPLMYHKSWDNDFLGWASSMSKETRLWESALLPVFLSLGHELPPSVYPFDLSYFCTSEHLESVFVPLILPWKFQCFPEEK